MRLVEKKLEKVSRSARTGNKEALKEQEVLEVVKSALESAKNVRSLELKEEVRLKFIKPLQLITDKPVLYVCNVDEGSAKTGNNYVEQVKNDLTEESAGLLLLAVSTEADINELESFEERQMFLDDLGLEEAGAPKLIRAAYSLLNQQTYFTAGEKEVRAWTIPIGNTAPRQLVLFILILKRDLLEQK